MTSFLLQRLVLPRVETTEPLLYVRTQGDVSFANETALLVKGAELSFDTSFGVFAAGRWQRSPPCCMRLHQLSRSSKRAAVALSRRFRFAQDRRRKAGRSGFGAGGCNGDAQPRGNAQAGGGGRGHFLFAGSGR